MAERGDHRLSKGHFTKSRGVGGRFSKYAKEFNKERFRNARS
jgi:hypothetical protein